MWKLGRTIRLGLVIGAALGLSAAPVLAMRTTTVARGSISGFEDAIPTPCGTGCQQAYFAGYFSANPSRYSGPWSATVDHIGLPDEDSDSDDLAFTPVVGGTFVLYTGSGVLSGPGMSGTISYGKPGSSIFGCTQTYTVTASIQFSGSGAVRTGSATASLTHYGTGEADGSCTGVYFATITGQLTLSR